MSRAAKRHSVRLRQSYVRVAKHASIKASRYAHAKQFKRMRRELRRLRTFLGRIIRDIKRKASSVDDELATLLTLSTRVFKRQSTDKNKLYSLHEPDVRCISKGKAHKRYEFGQKISVATTNRGNWFVAVKFCPGNPYDGHTLAETLASAESNTGNAKIHIAEQGGKRLSRSQRKRKCRRSAVEPKIGHLKSDHRMQRCFLKSLSGDAINATLAAAGANLLKLLRRLFLRQI